MSNPNNGIFMYAFVVPVPVMRSSPESMFFWIEIFTGTDRDGAEQVQAACPPAMN